MWGSFVAVLREGVQAHLPRPRHADRCSSCCRSCSSRCSGSSIRTCATCRPSSSIRINSRESRELMDELRATKTFEIARVTNSPEEARDDDRAGHGARRRSIIPPDYHDRRARGEQRAVPRADRRLATRRQRAGARRRSTGSSRSRTSRPCGRRPARDPVMSAQPIVLFNPEGRTANYIIPGLVAILLQIAAMVLAVDRDRARARAGHDGAAARHADQPDRARARQARAVPRDRHHRDGADPRAHAVRLRRADQRQPAVPVRDGGRLPVRAARARPHISMRAQTQMQAHADGADAAAAVDLPSAATSSRSPACRRSCTGSAACCRRRT